MVAFALIAPILIAKDIENALTQSLSTSEGEGVAGGEVRRKQLKLASEERNA
jgi:hypothetical protein